MSTIQHNPKNDLYMFLAYLFIIIAFMVLLNSCAASNKAHHRHVYHCDYSGANPVDKHGKPAIVKK